MDQCSLRPNRRLESHIARKINAERPYRRWRSLAALVTDRDFAQWTIRRALRLPTPLDTLDRIILEQQIFPLYRGDPAIHSVLFVGCDGCTAHYQRDFFPDAHFVTIEPDPRMRHFGSDHHVVARLENLGTYFGPDFFDLVICNGVYGWGLDSLEQCEAAFAQCHRCLDEGGHLLLGWDDVPRHVPVPLECIPSLKQFRKYDFPAFGASTYRTDTLYRHTYSFFRK